MINNRTNKWILWTILVIGVWIIAGCGSNPTTPGDTDVLGFGYEDGGLPIDADMDACLVVYNDLVVNGGGATTFVNDSDYTLVGAFENWSNNELDNARLTVQEDTGEVHVAEFNKKYAFTNLTFPCTFTIYVPGYVAQTLVATNANIIAFSLRRPQFATPPALVYGYDLGFEPPLGSWLVAANSTHNLGWEFTSGGGSNIPHTQLVVNSYRHCAGAAFIYEFGSTITSNDIDRDWLSTLDPIGYSYGNVGSLEPGAVGGWEMALTEAGAGTPRGTGNYSLVHEGTQGGNSGLFSTELEQIRITPGGRINASHEFVPYYVEQLIDVSGLAGTYEVISYDSPTTVDADAIHALINYKDGASEEIYAPWDMAGAVPNINFGEVPVCESASYNLTDPTNQTINVSWTNNAAAGYIVVAIESDSGQRLWEIWIDSDAVELPSDWLVIPSDELLNAQQIDPDARVIRVESAGFNMDDFTNNGTWAATSSWVTSATCDFTSEGGSKIAPPEDPPGDTLAP